MENGRPRHRHFQRGGQDRVIFRQIDVLRLRMAFPSLRSERATGIHFRKLVVRRLEGLVGGRSSRSFSGSRWNRRCKKAPRKRRTSTASRALGGETKALAYRQLILGKSSGDAENNPAADQLASGKPDHRAEIPAFRLVLGPALAYGNCRYANRYSRAISRHAGCRPKGWLRLPRHQRHLAAHHQRCAQGLFRSEIRRNHPGFHRRRRVRLRHRGEGRRLRGHRARRSLPSARGEIRRAHRPPHRPLPSRPRSTASSSRCSKPPASASPRARARFSNPTCSTARSST